MALILKSNETYEAFGQQFNDAYLVVDNVRIDKLKKSVNIIYSIYASITARETNSKPLYSDTIVVNELEYNKYYSLSVLETSNVFKQTYLFLIEKKQKDLVENTGEDKLENPFIEVETLLFDKWESDL